MRQLQHQRLLLLMTGMIFLARNVPFAYPFVVTSRIQHCKSCHDEGSNLFAAASDDDEIKASHNNDIVVSSIESTPNPSSFLIQLEDPLPGLEFLSGSLRGETYYAASGKKKRTNKSVPPPTIVSILQIPSIDFVFAMPTVLTINKKSAGTWETLLPSVLEALLEDTETKQEQLARLLEDFLVLGGSSDDEATSIGQQQQQIAIRIQTANGIPIQIEGIGWKGTTQRKKLVQPKFQKALEELQERNPSMDFFQGRVWTDKGIRYVEDEETNADMDPLLASLLASSEEEKETKDLEAILTAEAEEINAAYSKERLQRIVSDQCPDVEKLDNDTMVEPTSNSATNNETTVKPESITLEDVDLYCDAAEAGDITALNVLVQFVTSRQGKLPARRNALAFLGGTAGIDAFENSQQLDEVLLIVAEAFSKESSPMMRRTAGDALSDLGDEQAVPYALVALQKDRSKLVQWRAARILGELASSKDVVTALEKLVSRKKKDKKNNKSTSKEDEDYYAFEVAFEIRDALRKVRGRIRNATAQETREDGSVAGDIPLKGPMWKQIQEGTRAAREHRQQAGEEPKSNDDN